MDADTEVKMTETSKMSKDEPEKPVTEKSRGRGFRGRGRGGRMSHGVMRGGRGIMKGFGPPGHGRGRMKDGGMNGLAPMRGMGRMRPYPDLRGHRGRGGPMGMGPPPPPPPMPPMHLRGLFPPPAQARTPSTTSSGSSWFQRTTTSPARAWHATSRTSTPLPPPWRERLSQWTSLSSASPPPGRGQRWPGPPGGRRF